MAKTETKSTADLSGMSARDCGIECTPERCVITLINVCGHPNKGGLQGALQGNPDAVRNYQAARKKLAKDKIGD